MFDLKYAGIDLRKVAHTEGIRVGRKNAWYKPLTGSEVKAVIGDNSHDEIEVTIFDLEYIHQFTWSEIKEGRV